MTVEQQVRLRFLTASRERATSANLSAVRSGGPVLWVAGDATATVERLSAQDGGWRDEQSFQLAALVRLPGDAGLGVRELRPQGEDLPVLAGQTMDLDGPVRVCRWHGAMAADPPR